MRLLIAPTMNYADRDPFALKYNGKYYLVHTINASEVCVRCAESVDELPSAEPVCVFTPTDSFYNKEVWAPELHIIGGKCYIYVAMSNGIDLYHRMCILYNDSSDPQKPYKFYGIMKEAHDAWAIDGTVFEYRGKLYTVWSGRDNEKCFEQTLYIARMKNPFELETERVKISTPEKPWELMGCKNLYTAPNVNEGAFAVEYDGKLFLLYSASGSWDPHYCISYLELEGTDPMDPAAWKKHDGPILVENDMLFGSGHCSVIRDENEDRIFFHAWRREEKDINWCTVSLFEGKLLNKDGKLSIE